MIDSLQIITGKDAADLPLRSGAIVPDEIVIAIGIKHDRSMTGHFLNAVRIKLGLIGACPSIPEGSLGFDDRQWCAVFPPKYIIHEALAGS